jgi:RNA polymerase sigma factor (sigma-70 family)
MAASPLTNVIQYLRRITAGARADVSDEKLLTAFVAERDEAAFASLVRRHGPMVWAVCRRILGNPHDAEDAFQASFLVLARKAASIAARELLANWLYGVAHRTARHARIAAAKRRVKERQVKVMPERPVVQPALEHDVLPLFDQELSRLADRYRTVLVLCDLEGKTRREAAQQLGVPEGTVAGRLARARSLLAQRLKRHGVVISATALALVLSKNLASACVPPPLILGAIKTGCLFAGGGSTAAYGIPSHIAALSERVVRAMFLTKITLVAVRLVMLALLGAGTWRVAVALAVLVGASALAKPLPDPVKKDTPESHPISLLSKANLKLTDSLSANLPANNFAELAAGEQVLARKFFKIEDGLIHLAGSKAKDRPTKVEGIAVGRKLAKLNFLQGTEYGGGGEEGDPLFAPDGTLIGEYTVHYGDKTSARIPILYGRDLRDWWHLDQPKAVTRGVLAWRGATPYSRRLGYKVFLYVSTWDNPQPSKLVTHLDYQSANTMCAPFCLAISAESGGPKTATREFYHDFRNKEFPDKHFARTGPGAAELIKAEPQGLRVTLPANQEIPALVGVVTRFPIQGDCEITVGYEIADMNQRKVGFGAALELYLKTNTPTEEAVVFNRRLHGDGNDIFSSIRLTTNGQGQRVLKNSARLPAAGRFGHLRVTRVGKDAVLAVAEGDNKFREVYRYELGTEEITTFRVAVNPGTLANAAELRLLDFRVRAVDAK